MYLLYTQAYVIFFIFILLSVILSCLLLLIAWISAPKAQNNSKLSAYECGFDPFETPRSQFDVHFFIVALIFLIFDLEILYLLPWVFYIFYSSKLSHFIIFFFFGIIGVGFFYEWKSGVLEWSKNWHLFA